MASPATAAFIPADATAGSTEVEPGASSKPDESDSSTEALGVKSPPGDSGHQPRQPISEAETADASPQNSNEAGPRASRPRPERPTSIVPPFWQHSHHASRGSVASSIDIAIRLEDNTTTDEEDEDGGEEGGVKSPLWARHVDIDEYTRIEGDYKGVGGYTVWTIKVQTLDNGGCIMLLKRYSEFEALRNNLASTFPHAGTALPSLPPKSVLSKFKPSFLEKRRVGLKYFLNCVLLNPEFASCPAVRDFLFA